MTFNHARSETVRVMEAYVTSKLTEEMRFLCWQCGQLSSHMSQRDQTVQMKTQKRGGSWGTGEILFGCFLSESVK